MTTDLKVVEAEFWGRVFSEAYNRNVNNRYHNDPMRAAIETADYAVQAFRKRYPVPSSENRT